MARFISSNRTAAWKAGINLLIILTENQIKKIKRRHHTREKASWKYEEAWISFSQNDSKTHHVINLKLYNNSKLKCRNEISITSLFSTWKFFLNWPSELLFSSVHSHPDRNSIKQGKINKSHLSSSTLNFDWKMCFFLLTAADYEFKVLHTHLRRFYMKRFALQRTPVYMPFVA